MCRRMRERRGIEGIVDRDRFDAWTVRHGSKKNMLRAPPEPSIASFADTVATRSRIESARSISCESQIGVTFLRRLNETFPVPRPNASRTHLNRSGVRLSLASALGVLQITNRSLRARSIPQALAARARIVRSRATGESVRALAAWLGVTRTTVCLWRRRYRRDVTLAQDEWLDDAVELALHHLECPFQLVEAKGMRGEARRIDPAALDQTQQPLHPQPAAGA